MLPADIIYTREISGLLYACLVVFLGLFTINYLDYIKKVQENNYIEWDLKTITSGDYTVEFALHPDFFQTWVDRDFPNYARMQKHDYGIEYVSKVQAFRDWITDEMEARLDYLPDLGFEEEPVEYIKVALTTFAFKNADIVNLLKKRGKVIETENWDEMEGIDAKINQLKNDKLLELTTPCSVFMTFENEEGVNRAINFNKTIAADPKFKKLGIWLNRFETEITKASEPSDIIWENRHFTPF